MRFKSFILFSINAFFLHISRKTYLTEKKARYVNVPKEIINLGKKNKSTSKIKNQSDSVFSHLL